METVQTHSDFLSLTDMAEVLQKQECVPSLSQLFDLMDRARIVESDIAPYVSFKDGSYARNRVMRTEMVELMVLCWRPGQRSPIHDHNGSHGAILVHRGILWETTFEYDPDEGLAYRSHREVRSGRMTGSEIPDIHQVGNPDVSGRDLLTLHAYAPPLGVLKTYKLGSTVIEQYTPAEPDFV